MMLEKATNHKPVARLENEATTFRCSRAGCQDGVKEGCDHRGKPNAIYLKRPFETTLLLIFATAIIIALVLMGAIISSLGLMGAIISSIAST